MDEVMESYKRAIEKALPLLPVKNGMIDIRDISAREERHD